MREEGQNMGGNVPKASGGDRKCPGIHPGIPGWELDVKPENVLGGQGEKSFGKVRVCGSQF